MRRLILGVFVLVVAVSFGTAAQAAAPVYSYVEAGYNDIDIDELEPTDGGFIGGGFGGKSWHAFAQYNDSSGDFVDVTQWWLGAGWHGGLGEKADIVAEAAYIDTDLGGADSESGYMVRAGVKWRLIKLLELSGFYKYQDLGFDGFDTQDGFDLDAVLYIWRIGIGLGYESLSDVETFNAYVRFVFGQN